MSNSLLVVFARATPALGVRRVGAAGLADETLGLEASLSLVFQLRASAAHRHHSKIRISGGHSIGILAQQMDPMPASENAERGQCLSFVSLLMLMGEGGTSSACRNAPIAHVPFFYSLLPQAASGLARVPGCKLNLEVWPLTNLATCLFNEHLRLFVLVPRGY